MQKQPDKKTVQGEIEKALRKLNITSHLRHAGRTDRGVHALNQVVAFDAPSFWDIHKLRVSLNNILSPYIYVKKIVKTDDTFNPRLDARKRSYRYLLSGRFSPHSADYVTYYDKNIDYPRLQQALNLLIGPHDFKYFAKTGSEVNHYLREIYRAEIYTYKYLSVIKIEGNGFLRGQIRIIVDFMLKINENILSIEDLKAQLNGTLISKHLAPPNGLYLERVWY